MNCGHFCFNFIEKETYKKAREILDRFANGDINITPPITPSQNTTVFPQSTPYLNNTVNAKNNNLVQRNIKNQIQQQQQTKEPNKTFTPNLGNETMNLNRTKYENMSMYQNAGDTTKFAQPNQMVSPPHNQPAPPSSFALASSARTLLPRPIVAPNRTFFDKLLDFIIGEGPNNRLKFARLFFLSKY